MNGPKKPLQTDAQTSLPPPPKPPNPNPVTSVLPHIETNPSHSLEAMDSFPSNPTENPSTYKDRLLQQSHHFYFDDWLQKFQDPITEASVEDIAITSTMLAVNIPKTELSRIRQKWKSALIIKLQVKRLLL